MIIPYCRQTAEYLSIKRVFLLDFFFLKKKIPLQITIIWKDSLIELTLFRMQEVCLAVWA